MPDRRLYSILTLAGAAPFVAAAVLPLLGFEMIGPLGHATDLALSYGLAIVCFLAGIHWATRLYLDVELPLNLFVASNVVVLGAWFPFLLASESLAAGALIIAFAFLLFVDYRLLGHKIIDEHYFRLRTAATVLAIGSLLVIMATL